MRVSMDIGSTFTDVVAYEETGGYKAAKASTTRHDLSIGVLTAISRLVDSVQGIDFTVHGTTPGQGVARIRAHFLSGDRGVHGSRGAPLSPGPGERDASSRSASPAARHAVERRNRDRADGPGPSPADSPVRACWRHDGRRRPLPSSPAPQPHLRRHGRDELRRQRGRGGNSAGLDRDISGRLPAADSSGRHPHRRSRRRLHLIGAERGSPRRAGERRS
jgi:hypothetical protein